MKFQHLFFISILLFSWHQLILFSGGGGVFVALTEEKSLTEIFSNDVVAPHIALAEEESQEFLQEPEISRDVCGDFYCYSGEEFVGMFDEFEEMVSSNIRNKYVYNHPTADPHIQDIAEDRGYTKRTFAIEDDLVWLSGKQTLPVVKENFLAMREEMLELGMEIRFVSGYRSSTQQRFLFSKKVGPISLEQVDDGVHDSRINTALEISALPGYSKHHSGYAFDVGCGTAKLEYQFAETPCYEWMSENNFENAKRYGFIPSYPNNVDKIGPNPEPWEFVYVGVENID